LALASASEKAFVTTGSHLVEFLDTVSLAHFTATCKECRSLLDLEVARRKAKIQEYEERVKQLIGCEGEEPEAYVCANVEAVEKLCKAAMHLIKCGPFFRNERAKLVPRPRTAGSLDAGRNGEHPRSQQHCLLMLPTILCLPRTGEPIHPGREAIDEMKRLVDSLLRHAEQDGYELSCLVLRLASEPQVMEAFRYAARKIVWHSKLAAMPSLTGVLRIADAFFVASRLADSDSDY
jgi:hypothetical protein